MSTAISAPPRPRPYRRLVTSLLHTRFVQATGIAVLFNLLLAGLVGEWYSSVSSLFWSIFPVGPAGVKALLFSLSSILIFLCQISTLKIGKRCTPSNWTSIRTLLLSTSTYGIILWYLASAWWFCEVFIFTSPATKDLGWIINGGYGSQDKLNESPIYLRLYFLLLGLAQAITHVFKNYSTLPINVGSPRKNEEDAKSKYEKHTLIETLAEEAMPKAKHAAILAASCTVLAPFVYTAFFRSMLWSYHIIWAKMFANISRSDANPPEGFYIGSVMLTGFWAGCLLVSFWELNVYLFKAYILSEPVRNGQPLSSSSKDGNATLLTGLRANKDPSRTFAFWEFSLIAERYPHRRRDIFGDIERPQGPVFTSMIEATLNVLNEMTTRITPPSNRTMPETTATGETQSLPRILSPAVPAKMPIFSDGTGADSSRTLDRLTNFVSQEAKRVGTSAQPWSPPVNQGKRLAIEYSKPTLDEFHARAEAAQQSVLGRYFLTQPTRLINSTILGTPTGNAALIVFASKAAAAMLIASLQEDTYGKAVASLPPVVKVLTRNISALRSYVHQHTNGGIVSLDASKELAEVVIVYETFKQCLSDLLQAFRMYLTDIGLGIHEVNEARKTAELGDLFKVAGSRNNQNRDVAKSEPAQSHREMEEVSRQKQDAEASKQRAQEQKEKRRVSSEAETKKPQRQQLFAQLEPGSAYQESLRRRRKSISQGADIDINPLLSGSLRRQIEEPFSGNDFNSLPTGGLQRRKVSGVR